MCCPDRRLHRPAAARRAPREPPEATKRTLPEMVQRRAISTRRQRKPVPEPERGSRFLARAPESRPLTDSGASVLATPRRSSDDYRSHHRLAIRRQESPQATPAPRYDSWESTDPPLPAERVGARVREGQIEMLAPAPRSERRPQHRDRHDHRRHRRFAGASETYTARSAPSSSRPPPQARQAASSLLPKDRSATRPDRPAAPWPAVAGPRAAVKRTRPVNPGRAGSGAVMAAG